MQPPGHSCLGGLEYLCGKIAKIVKIALITGVEPENLAASFHH